MAAQQQFNAEHGLMPGTGYDASHVKGKSVVITGGASGIGEASCCQSVCVLCCLVFLSKTGTKMPFMYLAMSHRVVTLAW